MKRTESNGGPAKALDGAFLSTAAMPLFLMLGGLPLDPGETTGVVTLSESPGEPAPVQDEVLAGLAGDLAGEGVKDEPLPGDRPKADSGVQAMLEEEELPPVLPEAEFDGYLNFRTRSRYAEDFDEHDHDVYGVLGLNYTTGGPSSWGFHLLMRGSWGVDDQDPDSLFFGVQDTYTNQLEGRIYHAYVDAPIPDCLELGQFGRMVIHDTPETAYFDGARFETAPVGPTQFVVGAYGGLSVHHFEGWPGDEWMGGAYTRFRPWEDGLLRVDWMHFDDDDIRFGDGKNDLISGGLSHRLGDDIRLEGNFSLLDGDSNDMRLKGFWVWPEEDMTVRASYYRLIEAQENLAYELNPYFNILNTYYPYDESELVVSKAFSDAAELYGGVASRRVDDENDIGRYNRDYDRYYLTAAFPELLPLETTLSLTGEVWDSPNNDIQTWGLDLTSQLNDDTKASVGSYYSLYKYFFDVDTEREDVRTYYAELRNSVSESMNLMIRYEFEDEEIDSFHSLRLGVSWRF